MPRLKLDKRRDYEPKRREDRGQAERPDRECGGVFSLDGLRYILYLCPQLSTISGGWLVSCFLNHR